MGVANVASSAATSAAGSASSGAVANAGGNLGNVMPTNGMPTSSSKPTSSISPSGNPNASNNVPSKDHSSLPDIESNSSNNNSNKNPNNNSKGNKNDEYESQENDNNLNQNDGIDEENLSEEKDNKKDLDDEKYHAKDNQEIGPGQKIDENGNIVDTGNKKFTKALAIGAATYAGGTEGGELANSISKTDAGNKLTGVIGDKLDETPALGKATEDLGDSGVADAITDTADTLSAAESGDIKESIKSGKSAVENAKKAVKHYAVPLILSSFGVLAPILMVCVIIIAVCGPILGGFMDVTSAFGEFVDDVGEFLTGENDITGTVGGDNLEEIIENTDSLTSEVPDYDSLSEPQKSILTAAASGIASGRPYNYGGKPTGPGIQGIPASGIDCSGFVAWSIWTGTGEKPPIEGTSSIISGIGTVFEEISASELKPGDIGLKHKNSADNHTGIYAGNGMWYHAANSKSDLVRSKYNSFTVYLRYIG